MDKRHLRYFVAVAEELHFGRAAVRLHMSQPPLSQQIRQMEEELGCVLFDRTSRKVALTPEGAYLLDEARAILARLDMVEETLRAMGRGEAGRLAMGFVAPSTESLLPEAIKAFRQANPRITLSLHELSTTAQLDAVRTGSLDVGFIRLFGHDMTGLRSELFWCEPYVLAIPAGHRLALEQGPVALAELAGEPLITFPRHLQPALHDTLGACFARAGVTPMVVQEAITKLTTGALVAAGMGLSLLPASSARLRRAGVAYRPVRDELPLIEIMAVWRADRETPILRLFLKALAPFRQAAPHAAA
ncbi:MAG: LysR substrate-binding domain-containing protein [Desulfovibrionaceae bacterium]